MSKINALLIGIIGIVIGGSVRISIFCVDAPDWLTICF